MKKIILLLSALCVVAIPSIGFAEDAERDHKSNKKKAHHAKMFKHADENNDGFLTEKEMVNAAKKRFKHLDANKDGKVSKSEIKDSVKNRKEKRKERRDSKGSEDDSY